MSTGSTAGRVRRLSETVVNQIAAGEVVERPASVLKELVENALDAGAQRIEIFLEKGGKQSLCVLDDGRGMDPDDLGLCIERHTTSKITEATDLQALGTYGFRGEALSSIGSVAQLQLRSRTKAAEAASQITCDYGRVTGPERVAGPKGTQVTVRNLFEKIPARQKFLRTDGTEYSHCARFARELALGAPQAGFRLQHDTKKVFQYGPASRLERVKQVLRPPWTPMEVRSETDALTLEAYLTPPHWTQDRGDVTLVVNGRVVRNRSWVQALRSAYLDTVGPHHEPSGVVYLDIQADWVDVNVHPQKLEVRCLKPETLFPWIRASVRKAIAAETTMRSVPMATSAPQASPASPDSPANAPYFVPPRPSQVSLESPVYEPRPAEQSPLPLSAREWVPSDPSPERPTTLPLGLRYLGQIRASYLVCEDRDGLVIVDQHALHEKMKFESLKTALQNGTVSTQTLLTPKILDITPEQLRWIEDQGETLEALGFDVSPMGEREVSVKGYPAALPEKGWEKALRGVLGTTAADGDPKEALIRAMVPALATQACHSVIRANHALTPREAESLLGGLDELNEGWTCPHGRPVCFRLDYSSIENHFERT